MVHTGVRSSAVWTAAAEPAARPRRARRSRSFSASSSNLANRLALCAWHHLRGVHGGRVHVMGYAPARLRFELGVRPERRPLAVYRSGDVRVFE